MLLQLTQIGIPEVNGGKPTTCFLLPDAISHITRAPYFHPRGDKNPTYRAKNHPTQYVTDTHLPAVEATAINCAGHTVWVTETPEQIQEKLDDMDTSKPAGFQRP